MALSIEELKTTCAESADLEELRQQLAQIHASFAEGLRLQLQEIEQARQDLLRPIEPIGFWTFVHNPVILLA